MGILFASADRRRENVGSNYALMKHACVAVSCVIGDGTCSDLEKYQE